MKPIDAIRSMHGLVKQKGGLLKSVRTAIRVLRHRGVQGLREALITTAPWPELPILNDYAFEVPFRYTPDFQPRRVCAIVHAYYPELCCEIRTYLENVPGDLDLYISTTSAEKRESLRRVFEGYKKGSIEIRIFENRGRDIAPKIVGFKDVYEKYDFALHIHTKKSPHGGAPLHHWRHYLYEHLLGSPEVVSSIFCLLENDNVGIVFPQHLPYLRANLGWGANFPTCRRLLKKMQLKLAPATSYDFPSGSMFWCRTNALNKLLNLHLTFADFEREAGQIDGTLAHAIERIFLCAVEGSGYTWAKISRSNFYPEPSTILPVSAPAEVSTTLSRVHRRLLKT